MDPQITPPAEPPMGGNPMPPTDPGAGGSDKPWEPPKEGGTDGVPPTDGAPQDGAGQGQA